jgi:hypothetical protein
MAPPLVPKLSKKGKLWGWPTEETVTVGYLGVRRNPSLGIASPWGSGERSLQQVFFSGVPRKPAGNAANDGLSPLC